MYYRRKILLALVEAFGGKLKRTDCQKLLFLFCHHARRNFYDFFPYHYGGFSILSYHDKNRLADLGFLKTGEGFELETDESVLNQLNPKDRLTLKSFADKMQELSGNQLIRKAYLEYPHYACRSTILAQILTPEETSQLRIRWNTNESPCLFTIGYEGRSIDAYLDLLVVHNVKMLVDVRKNPHSMKYGFSKSPFQSHLNRAGIQYVHLAELGIPSDLRKNLTSSQAYQTLFEHYRSAILPQQTESLVLIQSLLEKHKRIALTCFEANFCSCHRHKITEYLDALPDFRIPIKHL